MGYLPGVCVVFCFGALAGRRAALFLAAFYFLSMLHRIAAFGIVFEGFLAPFGVVMNGLRSSYDALDVALWRFHSIAVF
jgi:hypothetical protein